MNEYVSEKVCRNKKEDFEKIERCITSKVILNAD